MDNKGYPPGTLAQLQREQVTILKMVDAICDELGLSWFADGGTCLGAVRHRGFIPWDDDIDVSLPLDDYLAFCSLAPAILEGSGYSLRLPGETPNYAPFWAKICKDGTRFMDAPTVESGFDQEIFIDVFPYAQLDSDPHKAASQIRKADFWQKMSYIYHIEHPKIPPSIPVKPLVRALLAGAHRFVHITQSPAAIYRHYLDVFENGDGLGRWICMSYASWGNFANNDLFPPALLPFEDMQIPVPHDVRCFLETYYGDYMALPPESERYTHFPLVLDFGDGVNVMESID